MGLSRRSSLIRKISIKENKKYRFSTLNNLNGMNASPHSLLFLPRCCDRSWYDVGSELVFENQDSCLPDGHPTPLCQVTLDHRNDRRLACRALCFVDGTSGVADQRVGSRDGSIDQHTS